MALVKAVAAGLVGALAIPYAFRGGSGQLAEWVHYGVVDFSIADVRLIWSWPIFCIVTLFAWALLAWADR